MGDVLARIEGLTWEQDAQVKDFMEQAVAIFDGRETWNIDKLHFVLFPDDSRCDSTTGSQHLRLLQFTHKKVRAWIATPFTPPDTPYYKTHKFNPEPTISIAVTLNDGDRDFTADFVCSPDVEGKLKACHWVKREKSHSSQLGKLKAEKRPLASNSMISFVEDENYETRVRRYCEANQIATPLALGRRPVSRYAVVDLKAQPHQLVALTFSRASDLLTYLQRSDVDWTQETNQPLRILDLKAGREMAYMGGWWLCVGSSFRHNN